METFSHSLLEPLHTLLHLEYSFPLCSAGIYWSLQQIFATALVYQTNYNAGCRNKTLRNLSEKHVRFYFQKLPVFQCRLLFSHRSPVYTGWLFCTWLNFQKSITDHPIPFRVSGLYDSSGQHSGGFRFFSLLCRGPTRYAIWCIGVLPGLFRSIRGFRRLLVWPPSHIVTNPSIMSRNGDLHSEFFSLNWILFFQFCSSHSSSSLLTCECWWTCSG